jgi:hypothetical protein
MEPHRKPGDGELATRRARRAAGGVVSAAAPMLDRASGVLPTSGVALHPAEHLAACRRAVRRACTGLSVGPEDRYDLTQDLYLKLLEHGAPQDLKAWLAKVARNLVSDWLGAEALHRELLEQWYALAADRPYSGNFKRDPLVWYVEPKRPPRICGHNEVEDATIDVIDARTKRGIGPQRTPTCPQENIAEQAIRNSIVNHCKRTRIGSSINMRTRK